jgi:hypothetical protein
MFAEVNDFRSGRRKFIGSLSFQVYPKVSVSFGLINAMKQKGRSKN